MKNFNKVCVGLYNFGYNADNINSKLEDFSIINIPYGGIDMIKCWQQFIFKQNNQPSQIKSFIQINTALIKLLKYGIVPLNKTGFYHLDVKGENILVDSAKKARLIDWGVSEGTSEKTPIPARLNNLPLCINNPFSTLLFSDIFVKQVTFYINNNKLFHLYPETKEGRRALMRKIAGYIFTQSQTLYGLGHFESLVEIIKIIEVNKISPKLNAENIVIEYLTEVLDKYVDPEGTLQLQKYFTEVLSKNIDVWGFIYAYFELIFNLVFLEKTEIIHQRIYKLTTPLLKLVNKYYFSNAYAAKPISIPILVTELYELNRIIVGKKKTQQRKMN